MRVRVGDKDMPTNEKTKKKLKEIRDFEHCDNI